MLLLLLFKFLNKIKEQEYNWISVFKSYFWYNILKLNVQYYIKNVRNNKKKCYYEFYAVGNKIAHGLAVVQNEIVPVRYCYIFATEI